MGCVDLSIVIAVYAAVTLLAHRLNAVVLTPANMWLPTVVLLFGYIGCFTLGRINRTIWRHCSEKDYIKILMATLLVGCVVSLSLWLCDAIRMDIYFHLFAALTSAFGVMLSRTVYRLIKSRRGGMDRASAMQKRLLVVGAGKVGNLMITDIRNNPHSGLHIVGVVDDDPRKLGCLIGGVSVLGTVTDIERICKEQKIDLIYVAIPSATNTVRARILAECEKTNCTVKILPFFSEIDNFEPNNCMDLVRDITPEELLGREPIQVADEKIREFVKGKTILITGGGGSIGSELCRQIALCSPKRLIIIDIYENNAYAIQQELYNKHGNELDLGVYIASVREFEKINYLLSVEKPQIVFHAAAHKHVPLMETSPDEAVKNNIFGTYNTALAAKNNGVDRFVLISTDKVVNPTNIMGASKRVCEMVIQYFGQISDHTIYSAVRFGNVLGSNGSVIPLFKEQIKMRHDITVTDSRITRYFMTIPEASQLVLMAGAMARGGEIFVLDMGEPVKIDDLARKMIRMSGLTIGRDINIRYIGLRPGEKLYEELLMSEEGLKQTLNSKIFVSSVLPVSVEEMEHYLQELRTLVVDRVGASGKQVEELLVRIVPTFKRYVPPKVTRVEQEPDEAVSVGNTK